MTAVKAKNTEIADNSRPDRRLLSRHLLVSPKMAREWLEREGNNRPLSSRHVEQLAGEMARGLWRFTGDPIRFDTQGRLLDGQHRLNALISANVSLYMQVIENLEPDVMPAIDTGKKRTASDVLGINGFGNTLTVSAGIRKIFAWKQSIDGYSVRCSHTEISDFANRHKNLFAMAGEISSAKIRYPKAALLATYWLATEAGGYEDTFKKFLEGLETGVGLPDGSPILTLRDWFTRMQKSRGKAHGDTYMYALVRAWNAYAEGRPFRKVDTTTRPQQVTGENLNSSRKFR